jgi:hypothetical protein
MAGAAAAKGEKQQPSSVRGSSHPDYGNYDDYDDQYNGQSYEYGAPVDDSVLCYTCEYDVSMVEGKKYVEGHENCNDPFVSLDIPQIKCKNAQCSKKYMKKTGELFSIRRGCLPNCLDRKDESGYTECCSTRLCNGYSSSYTIKDHRWLLLLSYACTVVIRWL